ncbi:hypothetical protein NHX12_007167 [Muraenolepis orangiensis]|uniref:ABC transporter domain-containing protein n=1 Tax=Muraenolepis orangiensis TaxID=630683 RepID=A0A9Q0DSW5_9TELE|nr:hypothetical protein NHX12_007167 [Muraenolepis orangiensis]
MAPFHQLRLLLWKNGLAVVRQPGWSLTVIIWPIVIFIILAVTRKQFPPVMRQPCYVGPRNLPSAGFFPFLQTLMCNTDSTCHNTSRLLDSTSSRSQSKRGLGETSFQDILETGQRIQSALMENSTSNPTEMLQLWNAMQRSQYPGVVPPGNNTLMGLFNSTLPQSGQNISNAMLESLHALKRSICTMGLTMMLLELMKSESNNVVAIAGQAVVMFEQLQNHSALWDNLLAVPYLFTAPSVDQGLAELEALFTNIQWALHVFQESFPETGATLSPLRPLMAGGINIINYIQSWPGRDVYITLGDVVTLHNDTLSEVAKQVLREIRIPLDKALCLLIDRDIARSYICQNSTGIGLSAACATGMVDMFLGWISPEKVAKQALLAWSKEVGPGDLSFVKGLLHSVGLSGRAARSVGRATEEPQNIDEDLFLNLGGVVIDSLKILPDADLAIQFVLRSGFFSMQTANLALNTVQNTIVNVLKDVHQLQNTYVMLMTNQPAGDVWVGHVLDSTVRMVMEILTPTGPLTCERLIHPYEWLLRSECLDREAWKAIICQNMTNLEQLLTLEWWPLFRMVEEGYNNILNPQGNNVTLPMILTEWHKLCNNTMHLPVVLEGMVMNGIGYWMVLMALASLGEDMERSPLWPRVSRYVYMASWIVNYEPGNTTLPPNCEHLKGTVNLLEHVYGDMFRELIASHIRQQIPEDEALSHYMINLTHHLHGFAVKLTTLKDSDISNPRLMLPYIYALLQSTGLTPLMSLFDSTSFNASTVLDVALKLGRQNQHLFTFNETDPTLPDLEQLITLLSMEGNLSLPLSLSMGHTLLTYSGYLRPEALAQLQLAIRPYTNQTSAGFTEAVLCAMELLSKLMDAPGGNPTDIILAYVQQLQQFLVSALRLRRVDQVWLSSGQLSTGQVTDLHLVTVDLLQLLTPEGLQSLTQAGPNATQQLIMQKLLVFLPVKDQSLAIDLLEDVLLLESQLSFCTSTGQNCVASISEIFTFLQQVVAMALAAKGNVTVQIASTNPFLRPPSSLHMTANLFSLFLPQRDAQYIQNISQVLHFTTLVMDTPHPTVSQVQDALRQSNLTLAELEEFTAMLGAADFNGFLANIVGLVDVLQCFTPQPNVTVQCAMSLISRVCIFLSELPALRNESMVFALIPTLLNKSILDAQHVNFSGNPHLPMVQVLNSTLANVKMSLHHLMLNSPEVMQEIRVLQHLLDLASVQQYYMPPISNETYQTQLGIAQCMFHWGNSSLSTAGNDINLLLQTVRPHLNTEQMACFSAVSDVALAIHKALAAAEPAGGLQSDGFSDAILEVVRRAMRSLGAEIGPLPPELQHNVLAITADSLRLIVNPDMSYTSARNVSLQILRRAEVLVMQILPSDVALYVTPGIQIISTYFETISLPGEQDAWNTLIFNELNTILRFLPKNSTAEAYMGMIQMLLNNVWPMFTEHLGLPSETPLVMGFVDLAPVLEQTMTGTANPGTWYKLEMMLNTLLSMLEGTSRWEDDGAVVLMIENILHAEVMDIQAENELIQSLQGPLLTLIAELVRSINSSHLNVSVIHEQVELAIQRTVVAAGQANESLECSQVVMLWEPVREAAGMDMDTLRAWCRVSLQPFLHSYAEDQAAYGNLNLNISSAATPGAANATAARITQSLQSLYYAEMNNSHVSEQLFFALYTQLSDPQPLSPEALVRYQIFQEMQLQQSLASLKKLSDKLLTAAPFLQSYMDAVWRATSHLLSKLQNGNRYRDIYGEAAYIFLHALNLTEPVLPPLVLGDNFTGLDGPSLLSLTREVVKVIVRTEVFGDAPHLYSCLEQFVAVNSTRLLAEAVAELLAWAPAAQVSGADALPELLSRAHAVFRALLAVLRQMAAEIPENTGYFGDLVWNLVHMAGSMAPTGDRYGEPGWEAITRGDANNGTRPPERYQEGKSRRRREAPTEPTSNFMDIFFIDYPALFKAVSVAPSSMEVLETAHMFLANPDLNVVIKGTTQGMLWDMDTSDKGEAIDGMLGVLAYLTNPEVYASPSMDLLRDMASMLGESLPFSVLIKNITRSLARESEDNMALLQEVADTVVELFQTSMMDERYPDILERFSLQVCELENMEAVRHLAVALRLPHGQLCSTVTPAVRILVQSLPANLSNLYDGIFNTLVGEPLTYNVDRQCFGLNVSSIQALNVNITKSDRVAVRELLRNEAAFVTDVQRHMTFDPHVLHLLLNTTLPSNLATLSWLVSLRYCSDSNYGRPEMQDEVIYRTFCSMSAPQWYTFSMLVARHSNMEKVIYRLVMSEELQSMVGFLLRMTSFLNEMLGRLSPIMNQLQDFMSSIKDLNLMSDTKFQRSVRGVNQELSSRSMLTTVSRALCNNGIMALFGISKVVSVSADDPSSSNVQKREEMIAKFKIPRDATPFCMNLYLDMVNTTGGAIAWAFLKPMLMGEILFTPNTPITRAIMEKSNDTLREFGNLTQYSQDWIDSSEYIMTSAKMLKKTLPMLQNSLGNAFVKRFIEMQTDINVEELKETLSNFGDTADMLDKNKKVLKQITVLSNIMVNISSCIKFDRYRGYDSAEEMNTAAQDLAKNRNLYAGVIFKLPGDGIKGHKAARAASSLPPKVSYTIRMHMDNVMRTDRVRTPYFVKDSHVRAQESMRYTRGFVYLQESIDRAIIAAQAGHSVAEPAVQLQPFPYPCFLRDEYLQAISFVFPLMLMIAWILFVADFVKKLVFERELRLHEYMKMMGVNPLSHFCAWFLDCAAHLLFTIVILTLVLKFSGVLPNSDGFLLFLFFCDYGLSIVAISFLVSAFFDKTYVAGLTGSLVYVLCFFPFIIVMGLESTLSFCQKSALGLLSPTCFSYATQYVIRYEAQGEGINWGNAYISPMAKDSSSFGWMCWLLLIDSLLYFLIGAYVRMVFPGQYGIAAPWYFPVTRSFWAGLCSVCRKPGSKEGRGLLFTNILQTNQPVFAEDKEKDQNVFSSGSDQEFQGLPVGVALHRLTKMYGDRMALRDLDVSFYEGHVTSLLGHNGAGKTTTMSLLTGLFAPSSGSIEVYGRDMLTNIEAIRKDLGVCMQYDVLFDHMTTKEHLLLYGQIKAPQWTRGQLHEQVHKTLEETGMYAHRHKRVGTLSGGMKRKLSISIAFIGGSRLVVLDEPTTGVDPWRTIIMSTHHLDEAEVLSDRIAFLESGGLKCCGSPLQLKDQLGQGYKLTLTRKAFIQSHVPEARLKEAQGSDLVYNLPPFTSSSASSYRSLLSALDANLDALQLGCYGISDTTLEEVFLQLTQADPHSGMDDVPLSISEAVSDTASIDSFSEEAHGETSHPGDKIFLTGSTVRGAALVWQQVWAMLVKRFHHSRRDWKGLLTQVLLPVIYVMVAMGLSSVKSDLQHYPEMELSPTLYNIGPSYSFFSNRNPNSSRLVDSLLSFPGIDKACLGDRQSDPPCSSSGGRSDPWESRGNASQGFMTCKCSRQQQVCSDNTYQPPHKKVSPSQTIYNLTGLNVENYLIATANNYIRNRYGGFDIGQPLPLNLRLDLQEKPKNRSLAKAKTGSSTRRPPGGTVCLWTVERPLRINGMIQILVALCVLTGYAIMTSSFAVYEVYEHHSGAKRLQHISGVGEPLYWIVNFFYDMVLYLFPVLLTVAVIAAFQVPAFTDRQNLSAVTLLLLLFGFATFPWMYLLAGVFKNAEMAFISYVCINLFISINTVLPTSILYFMGQLDMTQAQATRALFQRLSRGLLVFPQFSFGNGLMALARTNMEVQILSGYGVDAYKDPFSAEGLGPMFVASVLQGLVFFALRLLLNRGLIRKVRRLILGRKVCRLSKVYRHLNKSVHAVKHVSLGIPAGECFGLLGVNGAGKTTTFKMLTGDISPTDGTAQIKDADGLLVDIMECRDRGINIGYCPQVDALDHLLTGKEHLYFYARIRGIPKREIDGVVNNLLKKLELTYHRDNVTESYSCGTRRKLSTALALIGHPQILLLDEPSSGMDPRTKRHLWKIISEEVKGKCAVVLTSHSMEECEALCSRLAIMVQGQFQCLGSLQHIKNRFGSGFTLKMYMALASCDVDAITAFMQLNFPSTYLKDQHSTMVEYHVPVAPGGVADIFHKLESNKKALHIKHFSISQTTLDEVFINFAMGKIGTVPIHSEDTDSLDSFEAMQE